MSDVPTAEDMEMDLKATYKAHHGSSAVMLRSWDVNAILRRAIHAEAALAKRNIMTDDELRVKIRYALVELGVQSAASYYDSIRWSVSDLATDLVPAIRKIILEETRSLTTPPH